MATTFLSVTNNAAGTLSSGANNTDNPVDLSLQSGEGSEYPASFPFHVTVDSEILSCTSKPSADVLRCTRAQQGTTIAAHSTNASVELRVTAKSLSDLNGAVNTLENGTIDSLTLGGANPATALKIDGSHSTAAAWINSDAGTAASGLRFGTAPDVSLYRSAAGILATDGRLNLHTAGGTYTGIAPLLTFSAGATTLGAGGGLRGIVMSPTVSVTGNTHATMWRAFDFSALISTAAAASGGSITAYLSAPSITAPTTPNTLTGLTYTGFSSGPGFVQGGGIATTVASLYGFQASGAVNTDWTVTEANGLRVENLTGSGTVTTFCGIHLGTLTKGTTNISLRSSGISMEMRHAGKAIFGATLTAAPAAGPSFATLRLARTETITANGAYYAAALQLSPGYTGAFDVTTHVYIDLNNPTLAGSATNGNAAVFAFDANPGTHPAVSANGTTATTMTSLGPAAAQTTIQGWMKIYVNGTIRYLPFW